MNKIKKAGRNVIYGILNKCISILGPFVMRTIVLYRLGADYVGLSGMFTSLLQVLNFAELGFASAIVYSMYKPVAEGNDVEVCALLNYIRKIYKIISFFLFAVGIIILPFVPKLVDGDIPPDINLYVLYIIYLLNLILGYLLFAYKSALLIANQRNDIDSIIQVIFNIIMYVIQSIILIFFKNYYLYILMLPVFTIFINITRNYKVNKIFPNIICKGYPDDKIRNDIKNKVFALAGHKIGLPITNSIDSLVVSSCLGLTVLAIYDNYSYVFQAIGTILTICYISITPTIGNSIISENVEKNYNTFLKLSFINLWIVSWCAISLLVLYQNFMALWTGVDLLLDDSIVIAFSVAFYAAYMRFIATTYKDACGLWAADRWKPYVICISNLCLDLLFVKVFHWGILGVVITTLFLRVFIAVPWETIVLFKEYFKKSIFEYIKLLIKWTFMFAIAGVITYYVSNLLCNNIYNIHNFLTRIIIAIFLPNVIFLILNIRTKYFKQMIELCIGILKK